MVEEVTAVEFKTRRHRARGSTWRVREKKKESKRREDQDMNAETEKKRREG